MFDIARLKGLATACGVLMLSACAHTIVITPTPTAMQTSMKAPTPVAKVDKHVAYVIAPSDRDVEVTTPGGGGDKISYRPYRDMETVFYSVLSDVFTKVTQVGSAADAAKTPGIDYVLVPSLSTTSSSASMLTWPPTDFSITIDTKALNAGGTQIWEGSVTGKGHAEFDEFKKEFPLAARRAVIDAANQLRTQMSTAPLAAAASAPVASN